MTTPHSLDDLVRRLREALETCPCPHLANGVKVETYDDLTVKACIARGACGCDNLTALGAAKP